MTFEQVKALDKPACWTRSAEGFIYLPEGRRLWRERHVEPNSAEADWTLLPEGEDGPPDGWYHPIYCDCGTCG